MAETKKGAIVTLVERTAAFALSEKPPCGRNAKELTETVYRLLLPYKDSVHTIIVDNGAEFADHQRLARPLGSKIYFTRPYSSWEKGLIEYTNKLFRQYIPKKRTSMTITTSKSKRYNAESIAGQDINSIFIHQKKCFS